MLAVFAEFMAGGTVAGFFCILLGTHIDYGRQSIMPVGITPLLATRTC
jgi:hypothetical protein